MQLLSFTKITVEFPGVRALSDVSFDVNAGQIHALMGENGAGKSTLTKVIAGVTSLTRGTMLLDGQPVNFSTPAEALAKVQKVAQTLSFPVGLLENSTLPGYGRIWRIPVNFTIDRQGRLIDDGWKDKEPTWTAERLKLIVTPLLKKA